MIDTITDMVTIHDNDYNILYANPASQQILALLPLSKKAQADSAGAISQSNG